MNTYFYFGTNSKNKSGFSQKIWIIERNGSLVTTWWGPATIKDRRAQAISLQKSSRTFENDKVAIVNEKRLIGEKLAEGYELNPSSGNRGSKSLSCEPMIPAKSILPIFDRITNLIEGFLTVLEDTDKLFEKYLPKPIKKKRK